MKFDDVIHALGDFGTYQKRMFLLTCLVTVPEAFQILMSVFIMAVPGHRPIGSYFTDRLVCAIPELDNDTYKSQGPWHDELINKSIPWLREKNMYSQCDRYMKNNIWGEWKNQTQKCHKWVYSQDIFHSTFVTEMNMVCDDVSFKTYANMGVMGGMMAGSLILGSLADVLGRKKILLLSTAGQFVCGLATAFVTSYSPFVILKFLANFFGSGLYLSSYVIGMELVGPSKRKYAGIIRDYFWCLGIFLLVGFAYFLPDWNYLQIVLSIPNLLIMSYFLLLNESPRWLISRNRIKEASAIVQIAAKTNQVTLSENIANLEDIELEGAGEKVWHMMTEPVLLFRCLIVFFIWFVNYMVYYGLSLNVGNLSGDLYLNFFLTGIVEAVAYTLCLLLLDRAGRKLLLCFFMLTASLACICTLFPVIYGNEGTSWITMVLSLVGKLGASACTAVVYIYTAEMFPTIMRNSGLGICFVIARFGGIIAPYVADIGNVITGDMAVVLPLLIFGGTSIAAGLLALLLPETANRMLPDTVEDAKNFERKNNKNSFDLQLVAANKEKNRTWNPSFSNDSENKSCTND